jgi:hypothetical protein
MQGGIDHDEPHSSASDFAVSLEGMQEARERVLDYEEMRVGQRWHLHH